MTRIDSPWGPLLFVLSFAVVTKICMTNVYVCIAKRLLLTPSMHFHLLMDFHEAMHQRVPVSSVYVLQGIIR